MKHIKLFEEFLNLNESGMPPMEWGDFPVEAYIQKFKKIVKNNKNADGNDLAYFINQFGYDYNMEESPEKWFVEDLIDALAKKGFKNIDINDFEEYYNNSTGGQLWW